MWSPPVWRRKWRGSCRGRTRQSADVEVVLFDVPEVLDESADVDEELEVLAGVEEEPPLESVL